MKASILIIAHNEESHIRECIESVLQQSKKADEIVLIAHNCTDTTIEIVQEYPTITLHELQTDEVGPIPAREYGFQRVTGDIIACLDGDSYVVEKWLQEITCPFYDSEVTSVSGYPILLGDRLLSFLFFLQGLPLFNRIFRFYFWGGNFACRKSDYEKVGGMKKCREIKDTLGLHYPTEDCILSFLLQRYGRIIFTRKARSYVYPGKFFDEKERGKKQREDLNKIKKYLKK